MKRASSGAAAAGSGSTDVRGLGGPDVPAVVAALLAEEGGIGSVDGGSASIPAKRRRLSLHAAVASFSASTRPPPPPPPPAAAAAAPPPTQPAAAAAAAAAAPPPPARSQTPSPEPVRPPRPSQLQRGRGRRQQQRRGGAKEALPHDFSGVWRGAAHNLGGTPRFEPGAPTPGFLTPTARERHRRRAEERAAAADGDAPPKTLHDIKMRLRDSAAVRDGVPKRRCYGVLGREVMEGRPPASGGGGSGGGARFVSQAETAAYYAAHKEVTVIGSSDDDEADGASSSDTSSYSATGPAAAAAAAAAGYGSDDEAAARLLYDSLSDEPAGETAAVNTTTTATPATVTATTTTAPRLPPPLIAHRMSDRTEAPRRIQTSRHRCGLYASLVAVPSVPPAAGTLLLTYGGLRRQAMARRSCADPTGRGSQCSVPSDPATANTAPSNAASLCSVEEGAWRPVVFLPAAPPAVYGHALALLPLGGGCGTRHEVLVIGGRTAQGKLLAATPQRGLPRLLLDAATLRATCTVRVDAQPSVRNVALAHHTATVDAVRRVVFVVGGVDGAGACTADVAAFDTVSREWRPTEVVGAPPPRRAHHSAALYAAEGGEGEAALFVYGGVHTDSAEPSTYHLLSDLYRLDVQRGGGCDGQGLVLFSTKVTGVCGSGGGGVPRGVPAASLGHTMHVVDGVVCVVGGEEGRQWVSDADVRRGSLTLRCYDVATGVWSQRVSPYLRGVRGHSSCRVGGDLYVLGRDVLEGGGGGCGDAAAALLRVALRPTLRDLCAQFVLRNKLVFARPAQAQTQAHVTEAAAAAAASAAAPSGGPPAVAPSAAGGRRLPTRRRKPSCVGGGGGGGGA